jgi:hypothetical protein
MTQILFSFKTATAHIVKSNLIVDYPKDTIGRKTRADYLIEMCHRLNNKVYVDKVNT